MRDPRCRRRGEVADLLPAGRFVSIPVGHGIHKENSNAFVAAVLVFLGQRSP